VTLIDNAPIMDSAAVLRDAAPAQLADAVEANYYSWFRSMVGALNGELDETPQLSRYHCHPGSPIFKGVWGARLAPHDADDAIEETIAWFTERGAPFIGDAPGLARW